MSPKQWIALLCFYISYLFFGASVFYHFEQELETERRSHELQDRININELLVEFTAPHDRALQNNILAKVSDYCGKPVTNHTLDEYVAPYVWSFYHSFFFSFIVCSTIGYGNISPHNTLGRMFMIFYALIGIPVNGFLFAYLGEFFGKTFIGVYMRYKTYKMATTKNYIPMRFSLIGRILLYLIPGIVFFIFLPSCLFSYFEDWPYTVSIYYSFVTLTTIGFGDFVATFQSHQQREYGTYFYFYEIFIIFWFIFGLGYLVMILGFIAKGMRSKRITRLEHQLSENIKITQNRIWQGVTKDVGYLRRILNEVYMMKFKPVYNEDEKISDYSMPRSLSCPDLTMYTNEGPTMVRRRAYSDVKTPLETFEGSSTLTRVQSDSDLSRINKQKTFEGAETLFDTTHLLARVVSALGSIRPIDEDGQSVLDIASEGGIHGFSDSQILASERSWSRSSFGQSDAGLPNFPKQRKRAASVFQPAASHDYAQDSNEWTWSGDNAQIKEYLRTNARKKNSLYRAAFGTNNKLDGNRSISISVPTIDENSPSASNRGLMNKINPFKKAFVKRTTDSADKILPMAGSEQQRYLDRTARGRESKVSLSKHQYLSSTARGRPSVFSILSTTDQNNTDVLESTTIADLIRALEVVHTKASEGADKPLLEDFMDAPKRKMGTASLTPPSKGQNPLLSAFPAGFSHSIAAERRPSLRPVNTYTTIFSSKVQPNLLRRQSNHVTAEAVNYARKPSMRPTNPPPYIAKASPKPLNRRFSIRPTNLSTPPGQAPPMSILPSSTALQRRLSLRPSPLARGTMTQTQMSGRFQRMNAQALNVGTSSNNRLQMPLGAQTRNVVRRPAQLYAARTRHGSLSELSDDKIDRKRTESK